MTKMIDGMNAFDGVNTVLCCLVGVVGTLTQTAPLEICRVLSED